MKKNTIKLDKKIFKQIVTESVKKVGKEGITKLLKEYDDPNDEYWHDTPTLGDTLYNLSLYSHKAAVEIDNAGDNSKKLQWFLDRTYNMAQEYIEVYERMIKKH